MKLLVFLYFTAALVIAGCDFSEWTSDRTKSSARRVFLAPLWPAYFLFYAGRKLYYFLVLIPKLFKDAWKGK